MKFVASQARHCALFFISFDLINCALTSIVVDVFDVIHHESCHFLCRTKPEIALSVFCGAHSAGGTSGQQRPVSDAARLLLA